MKSRNRALISSWISRAAVRLSAAVVVLSMAPLPAFSQRPQDTFATALVRHGGTTLDGIQTLRIQGQSQTASGRMAMTISAELNGRLRVDYGQPVNRSLIETPEGEVEVVRDQRNYKQPFVGAFGVLDALSILGLRRLQLGGPTWTDKGSAVDLGRTVSRAKVDTGVTQRHYGRTVKDEFDINFDSDTGLISSITRQQFADNSMDLVFPVTYAFSDYRTIGGILFPYRIDKLVFGRVTETILTDTVEINPVLPETLFTR